MEDEWYEVKENELKDELGDATLSIYALEGSSKVDTIRILSFHKNRKSVILIDSDSIISLIGKRVA